MILTELIHQAISVREISYCTADTGNDDSIQDWSGCFHRRTAVKDIHYRSSKDRKSDESLLQ